MQPGGRKTIWHEWYAWYPVQPHDDDGLFWLETLYRNRGHDGGWEYKSFLTGRDREKAQASTPVVPGA
ncbi:hypothetical protein CYG48_20065 (plasmid) [Neorhizobium sp. SOG26]|jgi:hypothetical protein|uniref:hypothetical protein n=1 Tax=Neorhizobium sp. SOG26 TaxID=2060726 RepID=UPI000E569A7A|nr:hypothetical protein [Neorhizobium sp. SOG26]AXV18069.1 hypothetical protein CYG48_20065 [Neorhizobium sp. SOG26]